MKILLRGHIRNSFKNDDLYNLFKDIHRDVGIELYIQTWDIFANTNSWRNNITLDTNIVTKDIIFEYFKDLSPLIKLLIIDKEEDVKLSGRVTGKVSDSLMPMSGWKYMIYSMFHITSRVNEITLPNENIVITRFDILNNSNSLTIKYIYDYINTYKNTNLPLIFSNGTYNLHHGCENLMLGKMEVVYKLMYNMWNSTDELLSRHPNSGNQEHFFMYEYEYIKNIRNLL
jgi:hypothetical protein